VLYPVSLVGGKIGALMRLNPMTPIIDGYRAVLLLGQSPLSFSFLVAAGISVVMLAAVWLLFHRAEFKFAENIWSFVGSGSRCFPLAELFGP
jgi:homopolymeric O-antigen transport system permease protein